MKNNIIGPVLFLTVFLIASCAQVFYSPDAQYLAKSHQNIAIIPPKIAIAAQKKVDAEAIKEQQRTESLNFQMEIYKWLLKRKMQGTMTQEIQNVETTNALLSKLGYPENPLTVNELCSALGVDGILTSNFGLSKPMSEGAAIAMGVLLGAWGSTNEVSAFLSITDCNQGKLLWNFSHQLSGTAGSTPNSIVNQLMRQASRRMPYTMQ